jgi:hypothetical protein
MITRCSGLQLRHGLVKNGGGVIPGEAADRLGAEIRHVAPECALLEAPGGAGQPFHQLRDATIIEETPGRV